MVANREDGDPRHKRVRQPSRVAGVRWAGQWATPAKLSFPAPATCPLPLLLLGRHILPKICQWWNFMSKNQVLSYYFYSTVFQVLSINFYCTFLASVLTSGQDACLSFVVIALDCFRSGVEWIVYFCSSLFLDKNPRTYSLSQPRLGFDVLNIVPCDTFTVSISLTIYLVLILCLRQTL